MKNTLEENTVNQKKITDQIEKAVSEFSNEQTAANVDEERAKV